MATITPTDQTMVNEAPFGVLVVVYRGRPNGRDYLLLHRAHFGPEFVGDWAWGPPGGSREPSETTYECARRELREETGLELRVRHVPHPDKDWSVYVAEAPHGAAIRLSDEQDRFTWAPVQEALAATSRGIIVAELESAMRALEEGM